MRQPCCLCAQIAGDADRDLLERHLGRGHYTRRLAELKDGWHAIPSLGSLVPGHTLLCPSTHTRSFASLTPTEIDAGCANLADVSERLARLLGGPVQVFEHGDAINGDRVSCSVDHVHLHVVPAAPDLWPHIDGSIVWHELRGGLRGLKQAVGDGEYLLFADTKARWWFAHAPTCGHSSQVMRRALATAIGEPSQWNWRLNPRLEETSASLEILTRTLGQREVGVA